MSNETYLLKTFNSIGQGSNSHGKFKILKKTVVQDLGATSQCFTWKLSELYHGHKSISKESTIFDGQFWAVDNRFRVQIRSSKTLDNFQYSVALFFRNNGILRKDLESKKVWDIFNVRSILAYKGIKPQNFLPVGESATFEMTATRTVVDQGSSKSMYLFDKMVTDNPEDFAGWDLFLVSLTADTYLREYIDIVDKKWQNLEAKNLNFLFSSFKVIIFRIYFDKKAFSLNANSPEWEISQNVQDLKQKLQDLSDHLQSFVVPFIDIWVDPLIEDAIKHQETPEFISKVSSLRDRLTATIDCMRGVTYATPSEVKAACQKMQQSVESLYDFEMPRGTILLDNLSKLRLISSIKSWANPKVEKLEELFDLREAIKKKTFNAKFGQRLMMRTIIDELIAPDQRTTSIILDRESKFLAPYDQLSYLMGAISTKAGGLMLGKSEVRLVTREGESNSLLSNLNLQYYDWNNESLVIGRFNYALSFLIDLESMNAFSEEPKITYLDGLNKKLSEMNFENPIVVFFRGKNALIQTVGSSNKIALVNFTNPEDPKICVNYEIKHPTNPEKELNYQDSNAVKVKDNIMGKLVMLETGYDHKNPSFVLEYWANYDTNILDLKQTYTINPLKGHPDDSCTCFGIVWLRKNQRTVRAAFFYRGIYTLHILKKNRLELITSDSGCSLKKHWSDLGSFTNSLVNKSTKDTIVAATYDSARPVNSFRFAALQVYKFKLNLW